MAVAVRLEGADGTAKTDEAKLNKIISAKINAFEKCDETSKKNLFCIKKPLQEIKSSYFLIEKCFSKV
jgi:hypothetical protein